MRARTLSLLLLVTLAACQKGDKGKDQAGDKVTPNKGPDAGLNAKGEYDLDSKDILARTKVAEEAEVKHVLISWKELAPAFARGGGQDPRGAKRDNAAAAKLAQEVLATLQAKPDQIDAMIEEHGEDPGSKGGKSYKVTAKAGLVQGFKDLALRLEVNEAGIVVSDYGYHVMERVAPPPPDPLESADILSRPPNKGEANVLHILIGWQGTQPMAAQPDPRATARTKKDADTAASDLLAKVRAGGDMVALMKEFSEDQGSGSTGQAYPIGPDEQLPPQLQPFQNLAVRLRMDEAGLVKTDFGWHIMKRVAPPPPPPEAPLPPADPLDSADIMKRDKVTEKAVVKHILLGWTEAFVPGSAGEKRSRADLEKLVKATMARLKKGEKIDALMAELSEDEGSAKSGGTYEASPTAQLVPTFKALSLRLNVGEFGAVKSQFGIHIIQRVE
jgi:hypothetical protein